MVKALYCVCFTILLFVNYTISVNPWNVTADEFNRLLWHGTVVVDNWLYIDGGEFWLVGADSYSDILHPPTLSIDLSTSWEISSVAVNQIEKPSKISNQFSLWHEGLFRRDATDSVVVFGGDIYNQSAQSGANNTFSIWEITVENGDGNWSQLYSSTDPIWQSLTWPRSPASGYSQDGGGWSIGGYAGGYVASTPGKDTADLSITVVNTTTMTFSTTSLGPALSTTGGISEGEAHFVPKFGSGEGIVVVLGGIIYETQTMRSMSDIIVFDPATQEWFSQTATGDIPDVRRNFCITGAQSSNTSTYEIFVFGGHGINYFRDVNTPGGTEENADSTNVYILTLPAFRWIRSPAVTSARAGSSCQNIQNQMLSVGGFNPTIGSVWEDADPFPYGIGIFDLTTLSWSISYNATATPYEQSSLIRDFYSKNPANPVWDNSSIAALFISTNSTTQSQTPTTLLSPTTTTTTSSKNSQTPAKATSTHVGAIIGGVVGGLAATLGVIIVSICPYRRRLTKRKGVHESESNRSNVTRDFEAHPGFHETRLLPELHGTQRPAELTAETESAELEGPPFYKRQ